METERSVAEKQLQKKLVDFVVDNRELEQLESLITQFNLFEAINAIRQERIHSDFLAYLLTPHQNHGLGDSFARRLLQQAVIFAEETRVSDRTMRCHSSSG